MKNVNEFIKWALKHAKNKPEGNYPYHVGGEPWEYLWGTSGKRVTQDLLDSKYNSFYKKSWSRAQYDKATEGWVERGQYVADCQGLEDAFSGNETNANGNYVKYCTDKGLISRITRPYVIGEALFNGSDSKKTHIGWVCGFTKDGMPLVIHERGLQYGCVITPINSPSWKYRGLMKNKYSYDGAKNAENIKNEKFVFTRLLKAGVRGKDVAALKALLIAAGYTEGITAGNESFGPVTTKVVKAYQKDKGLAVDGIAGKNTITALGGVWGA